MNARNLLRLLALAACLWCLLGGLAAATETRLTSDRAAGGRAILTLAGNPVRAMTEVPFAIEIYDAAGKPLEDVNLALSLTMPFMPMPPNHPKSSWSAGAYRGTAIFTMAGAWQVHADVAPAGAPVERLTFDIEMVVMQ